MHIELELIYPRVGGYNARPCSVRLRMYEPPRATEVKALWRWWMRVVLAGAYGGQVSYSKVDEKVSEVLGSTKSSSLLSMAVKADKGQFEEAIKRAEKIRKLFDDSLSALNGFREDWRRNHGRVATIKYIELQPPFRIRYFQPRQKDEFQRKLGEYFGDVKVRVIKRKKEVEVELSKSNVRKLLERYLRRNSKAYEDLYEFLRSVSDVPRVRLALFKRDEEGEVDKVERYPREEIHRVKKYLERISEELALREGLNVTIRVYLSKPLNTLSKQEQEKLKAAIAVLLLALALGGLGSMTRRGFGSVNLKNVKVKLCDKRLDEILRKFDDVLNAASKDDLKSRLWDLMRATSDLVRDAYGIEKREAKSIPKVPSLLPDSDSEFFRLEVCEVEHVTDDLKLLLHIGNACLKSSWKKKSYRGEGGYIKKPGSRLHTWILGLPRSVKGKRDISGYIIAGKEEVRRPSSIHLKIFKNRQGKRFVIIYGFLSEDWPLNKLLHKSWGKEGNRIRKLEIRDRHGDEHK
ncbi:MAG: type III-B CRISPR module RAMP protein Cmr1, partial [Thermoprotei archaeon]